MTTHKEKIEIEVDVEDGYRMIAYRAAQEGEFCMFGDVMQVAETSLSVRRPILEKLPEPYVFPEWMKTGYFLRQENRHQWHLTSTVDRPFDVLSAIPQFVSWTPPTDAQYAGKPMKVTH